MLDGGGLSMPCPGHFTLVKNPVPTVHKAGQAPGPVLQVWKMSPPPGFDPQTFQPVACHYTNLTMPIQII